MPSWETFVEPFFSRVQHIVDAVADETIQASVFHPACMYWLCTVSLSIFVHIPSTKLLCAVLGVRPADLQTQLDVFRKVRAAHGKLTVAQVIECEGGWQPSGVSEAKTWCAVQPKNPEKSATSSTSTSTLVCA